MNDDLIILGTRDGWAPEPRPFGIGPDDLRRHLYLIGQTGSGKTTLLRNLILQHIHAGDGVGLIDPHGDLAEDLLNYVQDNSRFFIVAGHGGRSTTRRRPLAWQGAGGRSFY